LKRVFYFILFFIGILLFGIYLKKQLNLRLNFQNIWKKNIIETNHKAPLLAEFSFKPGANNRLLSSLHHYTIKIYDYDHLNIKLDSLKQIPDTIPVIITVEMWHKKVLSSKVTNPLEEIVNGKYDQVIIDLCSELNENKANVFLRFNPEMEVPVHRYPWQRWGFYIDAYRHFYELCKIYAPHIKQVWGPAGYPGLMEWYTGDDFVDAVSVTLKSKSETLQNTYPNNYPVEYDLMRRLHRLRFINKSIFVIGSEFSANDSVDRNMISSITNHINQNRKTIYSSENFRRPVLRNQISAKKKLEIGVYDPDSLLNSEKDITVEHLFVYFGSLQDGTFQKSFQRVSERNHNIIVTFEPFRHPIEEYDPLVLQHIREGKYDREINHLYSIILTTQKKVYLRFAHEMEIPIKRYPWQSQNPVDYIKSYRYFMNFKDSLPETIKRVWGPAGDRGSIEWWPGSDLVDYISISIYGLPDKNISDPEEQWAFGSIFKIKYWRLRFLDKP